MRCGQDVERDHSSQRKAHTRDCEFALHLPRQKGEIFSILVQDICDSGGTKNTEKMEILGKERKKKEK